MLHAGVNILLSLQAEPNGIQPLCVPRDPSLKCCLRVQRDSSAALVSLVLGKLKLFKPLNLVHPVAIKNHQNINRMALEDL